MSVDHRRADEDEPSDVGADVELVDARCDLCGESWAIPDADVGGPCLSCLRGTLEGAWL